MQTICPIFIKKFRAASICIYKINGEYQIWSFLHNFFGVMGITDTHKRIVKNVFFKLKSHKTCKSIKNLHFENLTSNNTFSKINSEYIFIYLVYLGFNMPQKLQLILNLNKITKLE